MCTNRRDVKPEQIEFYFEDDENNLSILPRSNNIARKYIAFDVLNWPPKKISYN